ncbi:glycosyltransferase [Erwiniaceae bacterium L1_54_6]|nr:glycosyltransferase [Erwiniaceae bacterium L1_54_6]
MKNDKYVILLSTADWDNPFWTNKQHVAVELSKLGYKVLYVDSLGLRKPGLNKKDMRRIFFRILKSFKAPKKVRDNIWVWSPINLPWNDVSFARTLNKTYLNLFLNLWTKMLGFQKPWLWTYNPLTTEFLNPKKFSKTIYHCVDEIKSQPGMPKEILENEEIKLLKVSDTVFVTAPQLYETKKKWNDSIFYFSNVADYNHFNQAVTINFERPEDLKNITRPILGFIGAVSNYKVDFKLLQHIAKSRPDYDIVIIGLVGEGDPETNVDMLMSCKNIHFLGPKKYETLPQYLKFFDVALLPNRLNEYTDNMFPMKFFEYLAAGKPVVSVNLSSIREFDGIVKIGHDYDEFLFQIDTVLSEKNARQGEFLDLAKEYTYESRMKKMLASIKEVNV